MTPAHDQRDGFSYFHSKLRRLLLHKVEAERPSEEGLGVGTDFRRAIREGRVRRATIDIPSSSCHHVYYLRSDKDNSELPELIIISLLQTRMILPISSAYPMESEA